MPEETTPPEPTDIPVEVDEQANTTVTSSAGTVEDRLAALEKEKKETYERLLRAAADLENYRKRARKDVEDARFKAKEEALRDILPVLDNLERAVAAANDTTSAQAVIDGVKLVLRQAQSALERSDVKPFNSVGEPFDPQRHEAISQIETAEHPPGSVAVELQKGYMLGARLLRPALVGVAKAPAGTNGEAPDEK